MKIYSGNRFYFLLGNLLAVLFFMQPLFAEMMTGDTMRGANYLAPVTPHVFEGDLRKLPKVRQWQPGDAVKEIPKRRKPPAIPLNYDPRTHGIDPVLQKQTLPTRRDRAVSTPLVNRDGQGYSGVNPPDTMGDVGQNYYVQMINDAAGSVFSFYNKSNGTLAAGPTTLDTLSPAGNCTNGLGDPVALYDELAGRWMLSEFSANGNEMCVYISKTADPLAGGWYSYAFTAANGFPDYPKYSVWQDAYYITSNESSPTVYALDRTEMLAGNAAGMQSFSTSSLSGFGFQSLTPVDHDGAAPPVGLPGYFMRHRDTEVHGAGPCTAPEPGDCLEIFEFVVDWVTPANSTFSLAQTVPIAEFDSDLCGLVSFACFPQPGSSTTLDPLREVVMWRLQYRNMGLYEVLVGSFVTDVDGSDRGGVRWFELRRSASSDWLLAQESTYSPDASNRWMSSIAMDGSGNIALGYNVADSISVFPSLRYAARLATDPVGTLPQGEYTLVAGTAANSSNRYGDYSAMTVDPVDNCTFWFTGQYNPAALWSTRIGAFKFDTCTGALSDDFTLSSPSDLAPKVCAGDPVPAITVDAATIGAFNDPITFTYGGLPAGFIDDGFSVSPLLPPGSTVASATVGAPVAAGSYSYSVIGTAPTKSHSLGIDVSVYDSVPGSSSLLFPMDGVINQPLKPTLTWTALDNASSYLVEIATDAAFTNTVDAVSVEAPIYQPLISLNPIQLYYWRVTPTNPCSDGVTSTTFSFTTADINTVTYCRTPGVGIPDNDSNGVTDTLTIADDGTIVDVDVSINATHTYVGDLQFTLAKVDPVAMSLVMDTVCGGSENIDILLDDESIKGPVGTVCPPTDGLDYTPSSPLNVFDGGQLLGDWKMTAIDNVGLDTGTLDSWCVTVTSAATAAPIDCSGISVTMADEIIVPGQTVTCNVDSITLQNVTLGGTLIINKAVNMGVQQTLNVLSGARIEVNEVP